MGGGGGGGGGCEQEGKTEAVCSRELSLLEAVIPASDWAGVPCYLPSADEPVVLGVQEYLAGS